MIEKLKSNDRKILAMPSPIIGSKEFEAFEPKVINRFVVKNIQMSELIFIIVTFFNGSLVFFINPNITIGFT